MNDSIAFLALATIFGVAMLVVGWVARGVQRERSDLAAGRRLIAAIDETDQAGA